MKNKLYQKAKNHTGWKHVAFKKSRYDITRIFTCISKTDKHLFGQIKIFRYDALRWPKHS